MDRDDDNQDDDYKDRRLSALSAQSGASVDMSAKRRPRLARQFSGFTTPRTVGEAFIGFPFPLAPRVVEEQEPEIPEKKEEEDAWDLSDLVYNWAQNTTFHGVKYLSEDSDVRSRKWVESLNLFYFYLIHQTLWPWVMGHWKTKGIQNVKATDKKVTRRTCMT